MRTVEIEYKEEKKGEVPPDYAGSTAYTLRYDNNKFHQRAERSVKDENGRLTAQIHEEAFDGTTFYFGDPDRSVGDNPAILAKYLAEDETDPDHRLTLIQFPYLYAAGFYMPQSIADLKRPAIASLVLHYIKNGELTEVEQDGAGLRVTVQIPDSLLAAAQSLDIEKHKQFLQGGRNTPEMIAREIAALESMRGIHSPRIVEFVLAPQYGYGVTERVERTASGKLILNVQAADWRKQDRGGLWLPGRCTVEYYRNPYTPGGNSKKPITTVTCSLEKVQFGLPQGTIFALNYGMPGSLIRDRTTPEARKHRNHEVTFTVSATGADLRRAGEDVWHETRGNAYFILLVANGIVLAVLIAFITIRHRKSRASQST